MPSLSEQIGRALRSAREHRGWTLRRLADAVGVSEGTASRWETASVGLTIDRLEAACEALNVGVQATVRPGSGSACAFVIQHDEEAAALLDELAGIIADLDETARTQMLIAARVVVATNTSHKKTAGER